MACSDNRKVFRASDASRESKGSSITADSRVGCEGNGTRVGVVAGNVAQGASSAQTSPTQRESLGAHGDAALELQGGAGSNCGAASGRSEGVRVPDIQDTGADCCRPGVGVVACKGQGAVA